MTTFIELNTGVEYLKTNLKYLEINSSNELRINLNENEHEKNEKEEIQIKVNKKNLKVKFDSSIFLDELFKRAFKLSKNYCNTNILLSENNEQKYSIGIDIVCYGAYNSKMAYVITDNNSTLKTIEMVEDHIGNLKVKSDTNKDDIDFIYEFQLLINRIFYLFGKRWYELTDTDIKSCQTKKFKIIEKEQYPFIWFDETRTYSINQFLCKFFITMFRCLGIDLTNQEINSKFLNEKFLGLCVTIPSDFHSYQRLCLKNCFEQIGLKNKFLLVNKSTSLALPFMSKNLNDDRKKFIIDFGSGYMNCSILQRVNTNQIDVIDHMADRSISSKQFFESCFQELKQQTKAKHIKIKKTKSRYNLYKVMNNEANKIKDTQKETWNVLIDEHKFELNMKRLGVEQLANSVIEKFKNTNIIDKECFKIVDEINDILICSDAVLYEYLEPLLKHYCKKETNIIFMDNDCASLGAALLASSALNLKTYDMLPYRIGFSLYNGVIKNIIESKTNFPCSGKHTFQTLIDNQKTLRINLYEGESPLARNCKHICEFVIDNLRKAKAGLIKIEVRIEFDQNGVLEVFAKDIEKNESLEIKINFNSLNCFESNKIKHNKIMSIEDRLTNKIIVNKDLKLAKKLQDFDYYFEYLVNLYKNSPLYTQSLISKKVIQAKKYISKNRLRIANDDLDQLKFELEDVIKIYTPIGYKFKNRSSFCILL